MGYQFYNTWPYYPSTFPTMEDHIDPTNHVYFEGLHNEIRKIEEVLGILPQGAYADVDERLDQIENDIVNLGDINFPSIYLCMPMTDYERSWSHADWTKLYLTLGSAFDWSEWSTDYYVYVKFVYGIVTSSLGSKAYIKLTGIDNNYDFHSLFEVWKDQTTWNMQSTTWQRLDLLTGGEKTHLMFYLYGKNDGGYTGYIYASSVMLKLVPKG